MSRLPSSDLLRFLSPFPDHVQQTALALRSFVWDLFPKCNELIYDNYNALAVGFSLSDKLNDTFCSFAVYSTYVNFGFNRGSEIDDPEGILEGTGNLYRRLRVDDFESFPSEKIKKLLEAAHINALSRMKRAKK